MGGGTGTGAAPIIAQLARRFELQQVTRKQVRPRAGTTMHPSREIRMRIKSR